MVDLLDVAVEQHQHESLRCLLRSGLLLHDKQRGIALLCIAARSGDTASVSLLLNAHVLDMNNMKLTCGKKPECDQTECVVLDSGDSPLHEAVICGHLEIVKMLLAHGLSVEIRNAHVSNFFVQIFPVLFFEILKLFY